MKLTSTLLALIAATPTILARGLPEGAHDAHPAQPRPNVCDDKCDMAFLRFYEQVKDQPDDVARARRMTCKADYSCSTSCGFTAVGCANPAGWSPPAKRAGVPPPEMASALGFTYRKFADDAVVTKTDAAERDAIPPPELSSRSRFRTTKLTDIPVATKASNIERGAIPPPELSSRFSFTFRQFDDKPVATKVRAAPRELVQSHDGPHVTETLGLVAVTFQSHEAQLTVVSLSSASSIQPPPAPTADSSPQALPVTTAASSGHALPATTSDNGAPVTAPTSSVATTAHSVTGADDSFPTSSTLTTVTAGTVTSQAPAASTHSHGEFTQFGSSAPSASATGNNAAAVAFKAPIMAIFGGLAVLAVL